MEVNSVLIDKKDNVVTVVNEIKNGNTVTYLCDGKTFRLEAVSDIPIYHKIAITDINKDDVVLKYGQVIGKAIENIKKGSIVNHFNIVSIPRKYEDMLLK